MSVLYQKEKGELKSEQRYSALKRKYILKEMVGM